MVDSLLKNKLFVAVCILFIGMAIAILNIKNPFIIIGLVLGGIICINSFKKPLSGLIIMIIILPFIWTNLLDAQIAGIAGLKVINLLALVVLVSFILGKRPILIYKSDKVFIWGFIILFAVSVLRSISYMQYEYQILYKKEYQLFWYLQSHLIKPLLVIMPFMLITFYIFTKKEISKLVTSIMVSMLLLSIFILILYIFFTPDKSNFEVVREGFAAYLGTHTNGVAEFYIFSFPLMLAYFFNKRNVLSVVNLILTICTVGILYSRTAYVAILVSLVLFLIFSGRKVLLPFLIITCLMGYIVVPSTIINRALTGLDGSNVNYITAGRTVFWTALAQEFSQKPLMVLTGNGRYGIVKTELFKNLAARNFLIENAHNVYIDTILDAGIFALAFFLFYLVFFFKKFLQAYRMSENKYYADILCSILVTIIACLIGGLTGMTFFPNSTNYMFWMMIGLGLAVYKKELSECGQENCNYNSHIE